MNEEIIANLKLQMALQEQIALSSDFVPNYTSQVRSNCTGVSAPCPPPPPQNRCCPYSRPTDLEMRAQQFSVDNQYAPQYNCCGRKV